MPLHILIAGTAPTMGLGPWVGHPAAAAVVVVLVYALALLTSGPVVRCALGLAERPPPAPRPEERAGDREQPSAERASAAAAATAEDVDSRASRLRAGRLIGKCENLLIVTLVLMNAYSALAIIFTAKSLVRREQIQRDPEYFLGGTLVNVTWSVLLAFLGRIALAGI